MSMSQLPMQAADWQKEKQKEKQKEEEEDIIYQSAIPGVEMSLTRDEDKLNLWARRLQMQWLGDGDAARNDLGHLNAIVKQRVRLKHQKDVKKRANQIRREVCFWVLWAVLLAMVLNSFALGQSFKYSAKVREEILGESEQLLAGVSTRDGVWDFIEQTLNPTIFPEDTGDPNYKWRKNTMIGALRLQQTRIVKNVGCAIPKVYDKLIPSCYPSLDSTTPSSESFGDERQFVAVELPVFPVSEYAYVYDLASDLNISRANQLLNELRAQDWLDLESAKLVLRNTYYNPGVDMFCSVSISFVFLASGGVDAEAIFRVLDPQRHLLSVVPATKKYFPPDAYWDTAMLAAELFFIALIVISFIGELKWLVKHGLPTCGTTPAIRARARARLSIGTGTGTGTCACTILRTGGAPCAGVSPPCGMCACMCMCLCMCRWFASVWHCADLINCLVLMVVYFLRLTAGTTRRLPLMTIAPSRPPGFPAMPRARLPYPGAQPGPPESHR